MFEDRNWIWLIIGGLIIVFITYFYCGSLDKFSTELLKLKEENNFTSFDILGYNDKQALKYFGMAIVLVIFFTVCIFFLFRFLLSKCSNLLDGFLGIVDILTLGLSITHIISSLAIPILQAICGAVFILLAGGYVLSSKS